MSAPVHVKSRFLDFFQSIRHDSDPSQTDVLREGFRESEVRAVLAQVATVAGLYQEGENKQARDRARGYAATWQEKFESDPDWMIANDPDAPPYTNDPRELAARIRR